jgi:hypothetical protein
LKVDVLVELRELATRALAIACSSASASEPALGAPPQSM